MKQVHKDFDSLTRCHLCAQHAVVHSDTFKAQVEASWELGDKRFDVCSPAWLAL